MATDYAKIREDHEKRYGTDVAEYVGHFHEDFYSNSTHFIFELLQNTEDALKQAGVKEGDVKFTLESDRLSLSHNGKPFDEADVISICRLGKSTKSDDKSTIGKFGIGFKSVYDFTDTPQIFSGDEHFEIRGYVFPHDAPPPTDLKKNKTCIILPFNKLDAEKKSKKQEAFEKIEMGLNKLRGRDILFLRHIKTLKWNDAFCINQQEEKLDDLARRVTITDHDGTKETWLIFSQGEEVENRIEIAFLIKFNPETAGWHLTPYEEGKTLYSYFPIDSVWTHLKFLVQGAFQTTKTRAELAPNGKPHNAILIERAGELLIEILRWLRKKKKLDWDAFNCLPIEDQFFDRNYDFSPMAEKMRDTLRTEKLLPASRGGFVIAEHAKLPQNTKLKKLFDDRDMIAKLFRNEALRWLKDGAPEQVKNFLRKQVKIKTLSLSGIMKEGHITKAFMRGQKEKWIQNLYALLLNINDESDFEALKTLPLIRLENKSHISSHDSDNEPQVYLSSMRKQHPRIIKPETIKTKEAKAFMEKLGIETHDDTDDLINEMQKRYPQSDTPDFSTPDEYKEDIERIIAIQNNDKIDKEKKKKFSDELKHIRFVKAKNMKTGEVAWKCPEEVYIATENLDLETLFSGVDAYLVHKEDDIREMLIHYGANTCLKYIPVECHLSYEELKEIYFAKIPKSEREGKSLPNRKSRLDKNHDIEYLDDILESLTPENKNKAEALWKALTQMPSMDKKSNAVFALVNKGEIYSDAKFIHTLNKEKWILDPKKGELKTPDYFRFDNLGWESNKTLQDKICFQPDIIEQFKKETGASNEDLEFLKQRKEIEKKKNAREATPEEIAWYEGLPKPPPASTPQTAEESTPLVPIKDVKISVTKYTPGTSKSHHKSGGGKHDGPHKPDSDPSDKKGPGDVGARTDIEQRAIEIVKEYSKFKKYSEPKWIDANIDHPNNPGYDLYELDEKGEKCRWIEVKGLAEDLIGKPKMSDTQRGFALGLKAAGKGDQYTHITVEYAGTETPQVIRYDNPTAKDDEDEK